MMTPSGGASPVGGPNHWLYASPHDAVVWERLRGTSVALATLVADTVDRLPTVEDLMTDLFASFYRADVRWTPIAPAAGVPFHKAVIERLLASPSYRRLHPDISGNLDDSAAVLDAFTRAFVSTLDPDLVDLLGAEAEFAGRKRELAQEAEELEELISSKVRPRRGAPRTEGRARPEDLTNPERKARLEEVETEMEALEHRQRTDYRLVRARADMRRHLDAADPDGTLGQVGEALDGFHRALAVWGDDPATDERLPLDERLGLFRRYLAEPGLRAATELLGRARWRAVSHHRSRVAPAPRRLAGITMGDDLSRLLPSEVLWLAEPAAEPEFLRRYAEHELSIYRIEEQGEPGRGPLVICLDESTSMEGARDETAKAVALALAGIVRTDGRRAAVIEFAAHGSLRVTHLDPGQVEFESVVEILTHFFGGGTSFDAPITVALDLIADAQDARYPGADVLIVTDGEARFHPDTLARLALEKEAHEVRLFAVCIGTDDAAFRDIAEKTWQLDELGLDGLGEIEDRLLGDLVQAVHPLPEEAKRLAASRRA